MASALERLDGSLSENRNALNMNGSNRSSVSHDGTRGLHSLTLNAASFVDLRLTRPPDGLRAKAEKGKTIVIYVNDLV